jgi:LPS-assembly lipoprotein
MWWRRLSHWRQGARLALVIAAAGLTAGCWQPLYGTPPTPGAEGVQDKFALIEIPEIKANKGTPDERLAVAIRNALQFDLHNGANTYSATYRLIVIVAGSAFTAYLDPTSGRPVSQIQSVVASYRLVEIATGKTVVTDSAYAHVDYDIPGPEQRFAGQRARRDAEDRAILVVSQAIRNRLASYFVAGT